MKNTKYNPGYLPSFNFQGLHNVHYITFVSKYQMPKHKSGRVRIQKSALAYDLGVFKEIMFSH